MLGSWLLFLTQNLPTFGVTAGEAVPWTEYNDNTYQPSYNPPLIQRSGQNGGAFPILTVTPFLGGPVWPHSRIDIGCVITDVNGNSLTPSILELDVLFDGNTTTYTLAAGQITQQTITTINTGGSVTSVTQFICQVLVGAAGTYNYRWKSDAIGQEAAVDGVFYVKPSAFP